MEILTKLVITVVIVIAVIASIVNMLTHNDTIANYISRVVLFIILACSTFFIIITFIYLIWIH